MASRFSSAVLTFSLTLYTAAISILAADIEHAFTASPTLSQFSNLISDQSVAAEIRNRSSLTILAVPNSFFPSLSLDRSKRADIARFHVLLQYLTLTSLRQIGPSGLEVATLFQTTGRAVSSSGSVNITCDPSSKAIFIHSSKSTARVLNSVSAIPTNLSILSIDKLFLPDNFDFIDSKTVHQTAPNITEALNNGHNFHIAQSMLSSSGVIDELENDENGAGITMFVPTDEAFGDLHDIASIQSMVAGSKSLMLQFHVLHSYYPLGSLESIVNPIQPTLATEKVGAGSYTLNISRINGTLAIGTGIDLASVTQTVLDQNPVAIFGVSRVLLPKELFGKNQNIAVVNSPQEVLLSPESEPNSDNRTSARFTHPDSTEADTSRSGVNHLSKLVLLSCFVGFCSASEFSHIFMVFLLLFFASAISFHDLASCRLELFIWI